jgi:hypothetical protein
MKVKELIKKLEGFADQEAEVLNIVHHENDLLEIDSSLTRNECETIFAKTLKNYDFGIGVNYEVLQSYVDEVVEGRE